MAAWLLASGLKVARREFGQALCDGILHRLSDYEWVNLKVKAVIPRFPLQTPKNFPWILCSSLPRSYRACPNSRSPL